MTCDAACERTESAAKKAGTQAKKHAKDGNDKQTVHDIVSHDEEAVLVKGAVRVS